MSLVPWRGKRHDQNAEPLSRPSPLDLFRVEMGSLLDRFDRFFEDPWSLPSSWVGAGREWLPSLDVSETDTEITVRVEVPGIDPKDLEITVSGQVLTIAGEKKEQSERKGENSFRSERRFGSFRRSVQLPVSIDTEKMSAEHKNGVVNIRLKKSPTGTTRRIAVKSE